MVEGKKVIERQKKRKGKEKKKEGKGWTVTIRERVTRPCCKGAQAHKKKESKENRLVHKEGTVNTQKEGNGLRLGRKKEYNQEREPDPGIVKVGRKKFRTSTKRYESWKSKIEMGQKGRDQPRNPRKEDRI